MTDPLRRADGKHEEDEGREEDEARRITLPLAGRRPSAGVPSEREIRNTNTSLLHVVLVFRISRPLDRAIARSGQL